MSENATTRWTVTVFKSTDIAVRTFLARRDLKKDDLSKFIEEAVKWRVFDQTLTEAREAFADLAPDDAQQLVDEAWKSTRVKILLQPTRASSGQTPRRRSEQTAPR